MLSKQDQWFKKTRVVATSPLVDRVQRRQSFVCAPGETVSEIYALPLKTGKR